MIRWLRRIVPRWHRVEEDIQDELEFHLTSRREALIAGGMAPDEAGRQAQREFGDLGAAREELILLDRGQAIAARRSLWWADLWGDVRLGLRLLGRSPGFSAILVVTLGLAIGGNSVAFTVLHAALTRGMPYADPAQLVHLWETRVEGRSEASFPDYLDMRAELQPLAQLEGYNWTEVAVARADGAVLGRAGRATPGFFDLLGAAPVLGRSFLPEEDVPDGGPVVLLTHGYWHSRFGADPAALDSTITLDGRPHRVVGVLPASFHFAPIGSVDFWLTLGRTAQRRSERFNHWVRVVGRMGPGVSLSQTNTSLASLMARLAEAYPASNQGRSAIVRPLRTELLGTVKPVLASLFAAMVLVVAIACANIASLLLARALGREREIRLRVALGAGRWRLSRQLLVESLLVAALGGLLGVAIAFIGVRLVLMVIPAGLLEAMPYLRGLTVNSTGLAYVALLTLATGLLFGLGPMLHALRTESHGPIVRGPGVTSASSVVRWRDGLIVAELALTLVLLAGTALVGRSLRQLLRLQLGFEPDQVVVARVSLNGPAYQSEAQRYHFFTALLSAVGELPGVHAVGAVTNLPLSPGNTNTFRVEGTTEPVPSARPEAATRGVAGEYFRAFGIGLQAGRALVPQDDSVHPLAIMLSGSLATRLFPGGDAVGHRLRFYAFPDSAWTIVGVANDVRTGSLDEAPPPTIYFSVFQGPSRGLSLVIRSGLEPAALGAEVRRVVTRLDPGVPVYQVSTMGSQVASSPALAGRRLPLILVGVFSLAALLVSMVGLYGVVSFNAARRNREFGIRLALGAAPGHIGRLVLRNSVTLVLTGLAVGLTGTISMSLALSSMLYGIGPTDPTALLGASGLLVVVTLVASYLPARRATRTDPTVTLRSE